MYPSPANTGYADNYWGCPNPANYNEPTNRHGEYWQTVGQWEQWQEAQTQPPEPIYIPENELPF